MSGERMLADRLEIRDAYPSRGTADVKFVYADEMSVILAALRSPPREEVVAECMDATHDAIHEAIYKIDDCERVKAAVNDALAPLKNRNDQRTPQERTTFDATPSDGPKPAGSTISDDKRDAERYRWLRGRAWPFTFKGDTPESADAAIDEAMENDPDALNK